MAEPGKVAVGDRVRVLEDLKTGDGRVYLRKDTTGIVFEIADPKSLTEDEVPICIQFHDGEDWVDFPDIEVIKPAAEVAQEPKQYYVTGTVKVELEVTVEAHSRDEADAYFRDHAMDLLDDFDSLELKKAKVKFISEKDFYG
jgi:hypothetical protein